MQIDLWFVESGVEINSLDPDFCWISNIIPLIGDYVAVEIGALSLEGKVVKRIFDTSLESTILLDLILDDFNQEKLEQYIEKKKNGQLDDLD